ncbi:flavoprotein [Spiroplasma endosymbiont of Othius punctulatus]|uniref:flavoprotein n=1 Tax=Spiroplasma endosymbiont of Othius punctulatus TaxID=3066289 RepID=UPI0030CE2974
MGKHINLIVTGSSKADMSLGLYNELIKKGYSVVIYATEASRKFVDLGDLDAGKSKNIHDRTGYQQYHYPAHFTVADEADLTIVYPATASFINRVSNGSPDDYCSTLVSHTTTPVIFAPSSFERVFTNYATQRNIDFVKSKSAPNWHILDPLVENVGVVNENYYSVPSIEKTITFMEKIIDKK